MSTKRGEREREGMDAKMTTDKLYCRWSCDLSLSDEGKDFLPQIMLKFNTGAEGKNGCVWVCGNAPSTTC